MPVADGAVSWASAATGDVSHHSTATETIVPTMIGTSLASVGSGRVNTAATPTAPTTPVATNAVAAPAVHGERADRDPDDEQDDQRRDDEDDLVGGPERLDRPVLQRQRHEVDDLLPDGDDRRDRPVDGADEELAGRQSGPGRHDTDDWHQRLGLTRSAGHRRDLWPRTIGHPWAQVYRTRWPRWWQRRVESGRQPRPTERLAREMLESALGLIGDRPETLDLKIAAAALAEMREAFSVFAPYRDVPKVTVFGSARTATNDPLYAQATEIARLLAERGWMVVTGAGPGIMQAAMEGAGREQSIGVSIRLPFEQGANPVIAGDEKYVSMKYFFTRKLMLVKESRAFVCLPGGFGTLDETFELLTLTQTGKGLPVPIIFLDTRGRLVLGRRSTS